MSDAIAVSARGLTRRFGRVVAVDGLDLEVRRAEIFGFLGPNGSGKSTTIRMLCGLLTPSAGSAAVLGYEVPRDSEQLRQKIGYMTQRFSLYDDLSVRENLEFLADIYSLPRRQQAARVAELATDFSLEPLLRRRAGQLSGGERQRLALAGATLHRPQLLFLDEPTSAVDPQSRRDFWETLFRLVGEGTTILVSTHYMDEAERCHQIAILDRGVLRASGAPSELMAAIDATVVEVRAERPHAARAALAELAGVMSIAQLGRKLHVLVERRFAEPEATIAATLQTASIEASVRLTGASLEDVFVAATRRTPAP